MPYKTLLISIDNRIATVTINRPDKLNALNADCKGELFEVFSRFDTADDVDVVILTGAGEKAFVAGTDISELLELNKDQGASFSRNGQKVFDLIQHLTKPVIAAVNGFALGGGCELALASHVRLASDNARFGQPEVNLGVIPGYGGTQRLSRIVGPGRAAEMILTGALIDAQEALRIGLVNKVVPLSELLPATHSLASAIQSKSRVAIRLSLAALNAGFDLPLRDGLEREATLFGEACASPDAKEGIKAFLEKRKPTFTGR